MGIVCHLARVGQHNPTITTTTTPKKMIIDTPEKIQAFRLLTLKSMLKLEIAGMTKRGPSAFSIIKKEFGFKGSKQAVLSQYMDHLRALGILA